MTTVSSDAAQVLVTSQERINALLTKVLSGESVAPNLRDAVRYAVLNGGKRVRPALAFAAAEACEAEPGVADSGAIAVELIHCYSLVHDDLPCMDDDDLRRGLPTCHKQFDEATALLAGDALQALAFSVLTESPLPVEVMIKQVSLLSHAAHDMVVGQTLDLAAEGKELDLEALETIHRHKTGALIRAAVGLGGLAAGAIPAQLMALDTYAAKLGLAFQVQDDVLDVIGDTGKIGKQAGADAARAKATYPALLGLAGAQRLAVQLHDEALDALAPLGPQATSLRQLAAFLVSRDY